MPLHALIIGGGVGGLAAAVALRRAGCDVDVYEQAPAFRAVGAGLTLWANAIRALGLLGLADRVKASGRPAGDGVVRDYLGRQLMRVSAAELHRRCGESSLAVHRADLLRLLQEAAGSAGARIHLGVRCDSVEPSADGVTARFADGASAAGDLLVGADGLHSVVRATSVGDGPPIYAGYTAWRGVAAFDLGDVLPGETWGRGSRFGLLPLADGRLYWFATANAPAGEAFDDAHRDLLARFRGWHAPVEDGGIL